MNSFASPEPFPAGSSASIARILDLVCRSTGVDFSQHRTATVARRIRNRMLSVGVRELDEYLAVLGSSPDEAMRLAERLTIKVSRFYRNRATFDALRLEVLPRLIAERSAASPLIVWVAGCGCGEEAYTLAMLLEEQGARGFVIGSDIDPSALEAAARGVYPARALEELPSDLAERYLRPVPSGGPAMYAVADAVRARVHLWRHDVTSGVRPEALSGGACAIVSCRNVLIYLHREAQERAFDTLRAALGDRGILLLGEAEWPSAAIERTLETVAHKLRLFRALDSRSGESR